MKTHNTRLNMQKWLLLGLMTMFVGCTQSKAEAIKEICTIPTNLHSDPTKIGVYLEKRLTHPDFVEILYNASDLEPIRNIVEENGFSVESCDIINILERAPKNGGPQH